MSEQIHDYLVNGYHRNAYTSRYVMGYQKAGTVYASVVTMTPELLKAISKVWASSDKEKSLALRYRPNQKQIAMIERSATTVKAICTVDELQTLASKIKGNLGDAFEILTIQAFNGHKVGKQNTDFMTAGDMVVDGTHYQVKYNKATFTTVKTLREHGL